MADFNTIKITIDANINTNGNQAITGAVMNSMLKQMVDSIDSELSQLEQKKLVQGEGIKIEDNTISVLIDSYLSAASTNPVQNKVVTAELEKKVEKQDVKVLIFQEHAYLKYVEDDGIVYFKGYTTLDWQPLLYWQFNAIVGKPLTFHFTIVTTKGENSLSTNKFEVYAAGKDAAYMTWVFGGLKYTLKFYNGEQIITTEPYEEGGSYDDTEIREELTELSLEVSGLSGKVEELEETSKDVFEAVFGTTTHAELVAAVKAQKHVICFYNGRVYNLINFQEDMDIYFSCASSSIRTLLCTVASSQWRESKYEYESPSNKVKTISEASTDTQYPSAKAVYEAIQQSGGGGGMTTPSGDPMHYLYVTAGAEYNDTGADIERTGVYGDTIIWKAGYWWLNELGDITNDQMRAIYVHWQKVLQSSCYYAANIRTNLPFQTDNSNVTSDTRDLFLSFAQLASFEVFDWNVKTPNYKPKLVINNAFIYCYSLEKILGEVPLVTATEINNTAFNATKLKEVRLKNVKIKVGFQYCPKLSYASIHYLITNSAATTAITLTLHATALANAEAAYLEDTTQDHTTYPTLSDWALSKNIQIATA